MHGAGLCHYCTCVSRFRELCASVPIALRKITTIGGEEEKKGWSLWIAEADVLCSPEQSSHSLVRH